MGIYKNDYKKDEDDSLWEIHEIRRKIHKEFEHKSNTQINEDALKKFQEWKKVQHKVMLFLINNSTQKVCLMSKKTTDSKRTESFFQDILEDISQPLCSPQLKSFSHLVITGDGDEMAGQLYLETFPGK